MIFDTHAHYDDAAFDADRDEVLEELPSSGVSGVINCGCSVSSSEASLRLAERYGYIYAAVGLHPEDIDGMGEAELSAIRQLASHEKCVAIGEIGLDYHYTKETAEKQKEFFIRQIELANEKDLPVIIHERDAFSDCYDILSAHRPKKGVMHSFSGNRETLPMILSLGLYIGVGGMLTFKNNKKTVAMCPDIPADRFLIETDAPYLSPEPLRGRRNRSDHLRHVAQRIGEIRGITADEVERLSEENARRLFSV